MILIKTREQAQNLLKKYRNEGLSIGFVPTMGALHEGHISLIKACKLINNKCICSIFINPTQFNNPADFEKYPITIEKDIDMLEAAGCDVLFIPSVAEMYPPDDKKQVYDIGYLETILEGKYRPGHFQGVCQVVDKLLTIVQPNDLYLGRKDYQQCMVIKKMIEILNHSTTLNVQPTIRETDGLAMSSRNMRLNEAERKQALCISQTLFYIKENIQPGLLEPLKRIATEKLIAAGYKVDYVEITDATTLQPLDEWDGEKKVVALIAAFLNEVRLIDNLLLN